MISVFLFDLPFKVNLKVKGWTWMNYGISPLLLKIELWIVLQTYRKQGPRNPAIHSLFICELFTRNWGQGIHPYHKFFVCHLSFKVKFIFEHQIQKVWLKNSQCGILLPNYDKTYSYRKAEWRNCVVVYDIRAPLIFTSA